MKLRESQTFLSLYYEPKDVEEMPCPAMPKPGRAEADGLIARLAELENLSPVERTACIDELAA